MIVNTDISQNDAYRVLSCHIVMLNKMKLVPMIHLEYSLGNHIMY